MNGMLLTVVLIASQLDDDSHPQSVPVYIRPPLTQSADTVYYFRLRDMQEKTRVQTRVKYDTGWREVPVINGYVPQIHVQFYTSGRKDITYDYTKKIPLSDCELPERSKEKAPKTIREKEQESPKLMPPLNMPSVEASNMQRPSEILLPPVPVEPSYKR